MLTILMVTDLYHSNNNSIVTAVPATAMHTIVIRIMAVAMAVVGIMRMEDGHRLEQ
jgi:hypothetical protein